VKWGNNGTAICIAEDDQMFPQICCDCTCCNTTCSDATGGAIITWSDQRNSMFNDIYAYRITILMDGDGNGTTIPWTTLLFLFVGVFAAIFIYQQKKSPEISLI